MKTRFQRLLVGVTLSVALALGNSAMAAVQVQIASPGGSISQSLPDGGGSFDVNLPLNANAVNPITVTATDGASNSVTKTINVTQLSLESLVVAEVKVEPLPPERIEELVNEGVIDLADPENFNVSIFDIVLTIGGQRVPISVPIVSPINQDPTGYEIIPFPNDPGGGGQPNPPQNVEVLVFETLAPSPPGIPAPRIYGVMVIEGRIKTLKEFFSARLLLMNTSGIFTLKDVQALLTFPDGGLTATLPTDGRVSFGDILPGDGSVPGQKEREFIFRGDEIGVRRLHLDFGGSVSGPGIPDDPPIAFGGSAESTVEVKGPPQFLVQVFHPPVVTSTNDPYDLIVEIQNTGSLPALYASLDLEVGADGLLEKCEVVTNGGAVAVECEFTHDPVTRAFGHIYPGESVRETYRVRALRDGPITSCLGISDQNIQLQVTVGNIGCLTGHFPPTTGVPDGLPTVALVPLPNQLGVSPTVAVTAFFSELMDESSIVTGTGGTFNVFSPDGGIVNGGLRLIVVGERTVAIWQRDAGFNILDENTKYDVVLTEGILDLDGNPLFNPWNSSFRTTGLFDDQDPPELTLTILPPVQPNNVLPGQLVVVNAYPADQGSGIQRVELRIKDLSGTNSVYTFIDQKTVFDPLANVTEPLLFTIDSATLEPGHSYQMLGTAFDVAGNARDATIGMILASVSLPPTIALPANPTNPILQGISVPLTPLYVSGGVTRVSYFLDSATNAFSTRFVAPWQTTVSTLTLPLGVHTVRVEAVDGLLQTGGDDWVFGVAFNLNGPQVDFGSAVDGATFTTGAVLNVNANIEDPVGVAGVTFYLDSVTNPPLSTGSSPFAFHTSGLSTGLHQVIVLASNLLGLANNTLDAASSWEFTLQATPPGVPPAAPTVAPLDVPVGGVVAFSGISVPNAGIDVANTTAGLTLGISADASGAFAGFIDASGGDVLEFTATDLDESPIPSEPTVRVVPIPPVFTGITLAPTQLTFTAVGQFQDIVVSAAVQGGGQSNVSAQAGFSSSAPAVASVGASGRVVAHKAGEAAVTVSFQSFTNICPVYANIVTLTGILVNPPDVLLVFTGATAQLTVKGQYSNSTTNTLTSGVAYGNSDQSVIAVNSSGLITALADGNAQVYVSAGGLSPVTVPVSVITGLNPNPTLQITSPPNGSAYERGEPVSVTVNAVDPVGGVTKLFLAVTGAVTVVDSRQISPPSDNVTRTFSFNVPPNAPIGVAFAVDAWAQDIAGLTSGTKRVTLIVADRTAPTVTLVSPTNGTRYNTGDAVILNVAASDAVGVVEVGYTTSGALNQSDSLTVSPPALTTNVTLSFIVPPGAQQPELYISAYARDAAGNAVTSSPVQVELTGADITPPETIVTAVSAPGAGATATVSYSVLSGMSDLAHVGLYFRRNGIGTFNRYIPDGTNVFGRYFPQSGTNGTLVFDSTKTGGDGAYEFYSSGEDLAGNREAAPEFADRVTNFNAGTVWVTIGANTNISAGDATFDGQNLRVSNAVVTIEGNHTFKNVELLGGAQLTHAPATLTNEPAFLLQCWTLSVASNAAIDVSERGYLGGLRGGNDTSGNTTNNADGSASRNGGSYGGMGGHLDGPAPNPLYGNLTQPTDLGSGGSSASGLAGGSGGGRIRIDAIHVAADGALRANGQNGSGFQSGGGSGGSIYVLTRTLSGRGLIQANGGGTEVSGGGGRIAVQYTDMRTANTALIQALGTPGAQASGGNGTVFLKGLGESNGTLVIDGQGVGSPYSGLPIPQGVVFDNLVIRNNARVIVDDPIVVNNTVQILTGSILTHSVAQSNGLVIAAGSVFVDATSAIDVSAKGYRGGLRDGNLSGSGETLGQQLGAIQRSGGSHGGLGGVYDGSGISLVYGSIQTPTTLGGGGSSGAGIMGGNGGGRVTIQAVDGVTVQGAIRADGQNGAGFQSGSGAGGSVRITTSLFAGSGTVSANGGTFEVAGGGGHVAVYYNFVGIGTNSFSGLRNVTALGGKGSQRVGSAGTLFLKQTSQTAGDLIVDEGLVSGTSTLWSPLTPVGPGRSVALTTNELTLDGGVKVLPGGLVGLKLRPNVNSALTFTIVANTSNTVTVASSAATNLLSVAAVGDTYAAQYNFDNVTYRGGALGTTADRLVVGGTLALTERSVLTHFDTTLIYEPGLDVTAGTLTVASNSAINVDSRGYLGGLRGGNDTTGNTTNNANGSATRSGGSYGGLGGYMDGPGANPIYGDLTAPVDLGSGGAAASGIAGGNGGGRVKLTVGTLTVDGLIASRGGTGSGFQSGGGSGGSVYLQVGTVNGMGTVTVNGGGNEVGGGGGRIAVHYTTLGLPASQFTALGAQGAQVDGGNGTVFFKSPTQSNGELVIDGGNVVTPNDSVTIPGGYVFDAITLRNQARVVADSPIQVNQALSVLTGSQLSHPRGLEAGLVIQAGSVLVDETSAIDVSGKGYRGGLRDGNASGSGETLGQQLGAAQRSGGSHGGLGGIHDGPGISLLYGSIQTPTTLGGGGSSGAGVMGGNGGGRVTIQAADGVMVQGAIRADGLNGAGFQSGSGAGGSVRIATSLFAGSGTVSANGGGNEVGGGGGRVAVSYNVLGTGTNGFNGLRNVTATGGKGTQRSGSAGTLYMKQTSQSAGDLIVDEGLVSGTSTLWSPLTPVGPGRSVALTTNELTLDGGVAVLPGGLVGLKLRPNVNSAATFTIVANTSNTVTVASSSSTNLFSVAAVGDTYAAQFYFDNVNYRGGALGATADRLVVGGTLALTERSVLTHFDTKLNYEPGLDVTAGTLTIASNSAINVDSRGYLGGLRGGNDATGNTTNNTNGSAARSGGSYGGLGGYMDGPGANPIYGDLTAPVNLGSGGAAASGVAGGNGGGRVNLTVGTLTVDGLIASRGGTGGGFQSGGGSGGSVYLQVGTVNGIGTVTVNGGGNEVGGGGGRIAVHYTTLGLPTSQFTALGAQGANVDGGNGTLYLRGPGQSNGDLIVDGGAVATPSDSTPIPAGLVFDNVAFRRSARIRLVAPLVVSGAVSITEDSMVTHALSFESGLTIQAQSLSIDTNSAIDVTARGYRGGLRDGNGSAAGLTTNETLGSSSRAGGSYGGLGAFMDGVPNPVYGSATNPAQLGSGGASASGVFGGNGGGRITLLINGNLAMNGAVRANGGTGNGFQSGGGSGGAVLIRTGVLAGTGMITANGGGNEVTGGGGRVAIYYDVLTLNTNAVTATSPTGNNASGATGTLYWDQEPGGGLSIDSIISTARIVSFETTTNGEFDLKWNGTADAWVIEGCTSLTAGDWRPVVESVDGTTYRGSRALLDDVKFLRIRAR